MTRKDVAQALEEIDLAMISLRLAKEALIKDYRWEQILFMGLRVQAIKAYREESGVTLKQASTLRPQ